MKNLPKTTNICQNKTSILTPVRLLAVMVFGTLACSRLPLCIVLACPRIPIHIFPRLNHPPPWKYRARKSPRDVGALTPKSGECRERRRVRSRDSFFFARWSRCSNRKWRSSTSLQIEKILKNRDRIFELEE